MDTTAQGFAYRCTPLSIANCSGWEIVLPESFTAFWKGGSAPRAVVTWPLPDRLKPIVESAFGHGVLTFHPGYLFGTSPGWAMNVRGAPNTVKHGIVALDRLVETDWLPFSFTMNWRFTQPGRVHFRKGECFCFISLVPHAVLDEITPSICNFSDDQQVKAAYDVEAEPS